MHLLKTLVASLGLTTVAFAAGPGVTAKSAIVMDADSGKVLWSKDADTPRFPASTTKVMTALLLIERCAPGDVLKAPSDVNVVKEASLHLKPGEKLTAHDMLYALMLRSANDAAYDVAVNLGGSVQGFAKMMNERAKVIGCANTHFDNPNGLNDPKHKTSARDLALIAREAMKYASFREAVHTQRYQISRSINQKDTLLVNHDRWLAKDPTAEGIKTGYTIPAGHCFVGSATRNGYRVIAVVLKSQNSQVDNRCLMDWAFQTHEIKSIKKQGEPMGAVPLADGVADQVQAVMSRDVSQCVLKSNPEALSIATEFEKDLHAPIAVGQTVGFATFSDTSGWTLKVPLVAAGPVEHAFALAPGKGSHFGFGLTIGTLFLGAYLFNSRTKRMRTYGRTTF